MNDYFSFNEKLEKLKVILNKIKKLYNESNDINELISLENKYKKLNLEINNLRPIYLKEKMKKCNHLFIKTTYKHFDDKNSNNYILFIDHYCLKCGCSTKKLDREFFIKENILIPSLYVSHNEQIEIIEESKNHLILDFKDCNILELIFAWETLKKKNNKLEFNELVDLFKNNIEIKENKTGEKIYEFKYLE